MTHDATDDFDHPLLAVGHPLRRHALYRMKRAGPLRLARSMELGGGPVTLTRQTALPYARDDCADALLATSAKESPA